MRRERKKKHISPHPFPLDYFLDILKKAGKNLLRFATLAIILHVTTLGRSSTIITSQGHFNSQENIFLFMFFPVCPDLVILHIFPSAIPKMEMQTISHHPFFASSWSPFLHKMEKGK
jgi:hypothetical protein